MFQAQPRTSCPSASPASRPTRSYSTAGTPNQVPPPKAKEADEQLKRPATVKQKSGWQIDHVRTTHFCTLFWTIDGRSAWAENDIIVSCSELLSAPCSVRTARHCCIFKYNVVCASSRVSPERKETLPRKHSTLKLCCSRLRYRQIRASTLLLFRHHQRRDDEHLRPRRISEVAAIDSRSPQKQSVNQSVLSINQSRWIVNQPIKQSINQSYLDVRVVSQALDLLDQVAVITSGELRDSTDHVDGNVQAFQNFAPLGGRHLLVELRLREL